MDSAQEPTPNDQALLLVLKAMRDIGIPNVGTFLMAFLASEHGRIKKPVDQFRWESFADIMAELMDQLNNGPARRRTAKQTESTSVAFGKHLIDWVVTILMLEMREAARDPRAMLSPTNVCLFSKSTKEFLTNALLNS